MNKRACIIANSPQFEVQESFEHAKKADLIIAADGAAKKLHSDLKPHIICGDFDSMDFDECVKLFPRAEWIRDTCQETNDLEKCIKLALSRGATDIGILCAQGGRLDHSLVTLSILERYHRDANIEFWCGQMVSRVFSAAEQEIAVPAAAGDTISLIPRSDGAILTLSGVRWPLKRELLSSGSRGVSNLALQDTVHLTVHSGVVFFVMGRE
jgi:thiamine pyrophosphokinase